MSYDLERFVRAQIGSYETALWEIRRGRKCSHWMWYIFPQIAGLGMSSTAQYYAIQDLQEAEEYLAHPILGPRLLEISGELLKLSTNDAYAVFGWPDDLKLRSSMTLFALAEPENPIFPAVLRKFFHGIMDERTVAIVEREG